MDREQEKSLIQRTLAGDKKAYEELISEHERRIFFLGLKFHKNYEDAEDFTQEVFLKAYEKIGTFRGTSPFSAWLYRIGYNHGINRLSKRQMDNLDKEQQELLEGGLSPPEEELEKKEERNLVRTIVKKLPEMYHIVIRMRFFDGLTYDQIAQVVGKPVNTVKSHIFRAKELIRDAWKKHLSR